MHHGGGRTSALARFVPPEGGQSEWGEARRQRLPPVLLRMGTLAFSRTALDERPKEETNMGDQSCTKRKWLLAIAAGALATFAAAPSGYAQGTWTGLAPVPLPTEGMTVGGVGKVIIAAYGASSGADTNATRLYNITADSWSSGLSGPGAARSEAAYGDTTHA